MNTSIKRIYFYTELKIYFIIDYSDSREFKGYKLDCFQRDLNIEENKLKQIGFEKCTMIEYFFKTNKLQLER
jgi:hypothetical protein